MITRSTYFQRKRRAYRLASASFPSSKPSHHQPYLRTKVPNRADVRGHQAHAHRRGQVPLTSMPSDGLREVDLCRASSRAPRGTSCALLHIRPPEITCIGLHVHRWQTPWPRSENEKALASRAPRPKPRPCANSSSANNWLAPSAT